MIRKIVAKKEFEVTDQEAGISVKVAKGDKGELITSKARNGYTVLINGKTLTLEKKEDVRLLFKPE